jgi:hypothetical protein
MAMKPQAGHGPGHHQRAFGRLVQVAQAWRGRRPPARPCGALQCPPGTTGWDAAGQRRPPASTYSARPPSSTGRRPQRSATGPHASCAGRRPGSWPTSSAGPRAIDAPSCRPAAAGPAASESVVTGCRPSSTASTTAARRADGRSGMLPVGPWAGAVATLVPGSLLTRSARPGAGSATGRRQLAQHDAADAHPLQADHPRPTSSHMRRIWRLRPSRSTKRSWSSLAQLTRAGLSARSSSSSPWRSALALLGWQRPRMHVLHAHQVFLLHTAVFADQQLGDAAVLRQHQQAGGIDVQPAGRRQAAQVAVVEAQRQLVVAPAVGGSDQHHGGLITVFRLARHIAHRLVQQHRDALRLLLARRGSISIRASGCTRWPSTATGR